MFLISHRGNINGKTPESENSPAYIDKAIEGGFNVEIDVWYKDGEWYLGHDIPKYHINFNYLKNQKLWCHAKNIEALNIMLKEGVHCFWHQEDNYTLTSRGYIWTYPEKILTDLSICVSLEKNNKISKKVIGICSDYIISYKDKYREGI
jgi:hypothetical protein